MNHSDITGLVLAGGRGRRLGGLDKGLLQVRDRPLIEHVLAQLTPQVGRVLVNANRNGDTYARYGHPVVADADGDYDGPLAGMASGLAAATTEYVLCVPCDAAFLPPDLAQRMRAAIEAGHGRICAVHDGVWLHPVCALIPRALLGDLRRWLAEGHREVAAWLQRHSLATVRYPDWPSEFWSLNTPEDLARLEARLEAGTPLRSVA